MYSRILRRQSLDPGESIIVSATLTSIGDLITASNTAVKVPTNLPDPAKVTLTAILTRTATFTRTVTISASASPIPPAVSTKATSHNVATPILATLGGFITLIILSIMFVYKRRHAGRKSSFALAAGLQSHTMDVAGPAEIYPESLSPLHQPIAEKRPESFSEGYLERGLTAGLDPSHNTSTFDERTEADVPPDLPPQYAVGRDPPAIILGERRRGKRVARDGGVLLDQGPGAEEMRHQRSVRSVRTEFSVGTVPSTSASTLPPPYGTYD